MDSSFASLLLTTVPLYARNELAELGVELEATLRARWRAAALTWPDAALEPALFWPYVGARLSVDADPWDSLQALRIEDLYIACACAAGDPGALAMFEARVLCAAVASLSRLRLGAAQLDELKQRLRQLLFTSDGGRPRIAAYAGRGDLVSWTRVVAVRTGFKLLRQQRDLLPVDLERPGRPERLGRERASASDGDVEMRYLKRHYRSLFGAAFKDALAALGRDQKSLLRQYYFDGATLEQIAAEAQTHRVTIARRLEAARLQLREHIRRGLMHRIRVSLPECDSIVRMVQSQFDLTFA
jgi:RNA polymerase sigma-70 factor (ECF subfamily)